MEAFPSVTHPCSFVDIFFLDVFPLPDESAKKHKRRKKEKEKYSWRRIEELMEQRALLADALLMCRTPPASWLFLFLFRTK